MMSKSRFIKLYFTICVMLTINVLSFCQMNATYIAQHGVSNNNLTEGSVLIANDKKGNTIQAGIFGGTFTSNYVLGDKTIIGNSFLNGYISKLNFENEVEWALKIGGNNQLIFRFMEVDSKGNIIICGSFRGTVDFNPDPLITKNVTGSFTNITNFILKLANNGEFLWVSTFGGRSWDTVGEAFAIDNSDNIIVAGTFTNTFYYDSFTMNTTGSLLYCIKVNEEDGKIIWGEKYILTYNDFNMDISIDESNNIFILAQFTHNLTFELTPPYRFVTAEGKTDIYVVKLSSKGEYLKFKNFKLAGEQQAKVIMHDDEDNIIMLFKSILSETSNDYVHLIEKYSKDFGKLLWSKSLPNSNITDVVLNKHNDIVFIGDFGGTSMFDPSTSKYKIIGNGKAFVSKISKDGLFLAENILNTTGVIKPSQIKFSAPNQITVVGFILSKAFLNPIDTSLFISDENKIENFTFRWNDLCPSVIYKNETKHECSPFSYIDSLISSSGLYIFRSANGSGCLEENRLTATVSELRATIIATQDLIFTTETKAKQYLWTNCDDTSLPFVSNANFYMPPKIGSYNLEIKDQNCYDSSGVCIDFPQISLLPKTNENNFGKIVRLSKNGFGFIAGNDIFKNGKVDIYQVTPGNGWKLIQTLQSPLGPNHSFGYEISSHNNLLLISDIDAGNNNGMCHIYKFSNNLYTFEKTLSNPDNHTDLDFGKKTGIYNELIVISSPGDDSNIIQTKKGKVFLFKYEHLNTTLHQQISHQGSANDGGFGTGISISEKYLFISSPKVKIDNNTSGLTYIYQIFRNETSVILKDSILNLRGIKEYGKMLKSTSSYLCVSGVSQYSIYKNVLDRWLYVHKVDLDNSEVINDIAMHEDRLIYSIYDKDARVKLENLRTGEIENIAISNTTIPFAFNKFFLDIDDNYIIVGIPEFDIFGIDNGLVFVHEFNKTSSSENLIPDYLKIKVYPNPAKDVLFIDGIELLESKITIFDMVGNVLMTADKSPIDISTFPPGLLILRLTVGNKYMSTFKIIKS